MQVVPVAPLEDLALREGALCECLRAHLDVLQRGISRVDAEDGQVGIEQEARLASAADDQIKVVEPMGAEEELEHYLRVVVERVGEKEDLLATQLQLREHRGELRRLVNVFGGLHGHRVFDLSVAMAQVHSTPHLLVDGGV